MNEILMSYSVMALLMIALIWYWSGFGSIEFHYFVLIVLSLIILAISLGVKYFEKLESSSLNKKLPIKIKIPFSEISIHIFNHSLGFIVFILAILTIPLTWKVWFVGLIISCAWSYFINHPHVWMKDSFDLKDRLNHPEKYRIEYEEGCFEYPEGWQGFIFHPETNQEKSIKIQWAEINLVDAQWIDFYTYKEIQLYILAKHQILKIFETTKGYQLFYQKLEENLLNFESLKMLVYLTEDFSGSINIYKKIETHQ